jgi:excisionase family DNA binding protein
MADYLTLEEAAAKLGIPTDRLVELRSQGQVRGFRDGASWKFPEAEVDRLRDELTDLGAGSGMLVSEQELGSASPASSSSIIGGDDLLVDKDDTGGSDLEIGGEKVKPGSSGGSDVNLVASDGNGSDVALVAAEDDVADIEVDNDLIEIDSGELQLEEPAISGGSSRLELAIDPKEGSTGSFAKGDLGTDATPTEPDESASAIDLGGETDLGGKSDGDLSFAGTIADEDSDDMLIGEDSSEMDVLGSDIGSSPMSGASSLELMDDLSGTAGNAPGKGSSGADVLSELDLLSAEQGGSGGLVTGDSEDLLVSSGMGNLDKSSGLGSSLGDDVLADMDDDDLVIADDDDDLLMDSAGSDISVAGDSGINLMSPSDSGLSLESEPLDLAGSSISALDLGAELLDSGGSGSAIASGGEGSAIDFQSDEEFQLSPSGVGFDTDESGSQVIEVEDSEAISEAVEFEDADFGAPAEAMDGGVFADDSAAFGEATPLVDEGAAVAFDETSPAAVSAPAGVGGYEVPFSLMQCGALLGIICVMCVGGMLMTDLLRNMWTYTEPSAPVSSLTDALIETAGWDK